METLDYDVAVLIEVYAQSNFSSRYSEGHSARAASDALTISIPVHYFVQVTVIIIWSHH